MRFCEKQKWIDANPAVEIKAPKVLNRPTFPFTPEEMLKIMAGIDKYAKLAGTANAQRLRAFVLLLRYSGMRIGDTVQCGPARLRGNKLFLYTQKTGVPVQCGVQGGHAHRVRDTFAIELLLKGIPLDRVSVLLGHQSICITERHYAPWTLSRQEQIERDLQASWTEDPVILSRTKGTPEVDEKPELIH